MPAEIPPGGPSSSEDENSDPQIPKDQLISLIVSQLQHYGHNNIAQVVAEATGVPLTFDPSPRLAEMCYIASQSDGTLEIAPANSSSDDEMDNNDGVLEADKGAAPNPTYSIDGKYLATGSQDCSIKVLDVGRIKAAHHSANDEKPVIRTLYDHLGPINEVAFHPNGVILASASDDCTIKLYDLAKPSAKKSFRYIQDASAVRSIHFHPSGDFIVAGTDHEVVRVFDIHTLKSFAPPNPSDRHAGPINK
ncbi:WD40-repeat-containing domain protein, partial [Blyttiomyces helicus]